jgi:hypothetical protein
MSFMRWPCCAAGGVKQSEEYAQPLRRGSGDSMYTRKAYEHGKPQSVVSNDQPGSPRTGAFFFQDYFLFFRKVSTRELPLPIFRNPFVSKRPHISAGSGYAAADFRRIGVHKRAEPRNSRQNAVTVPVTPSCPNYFYMCLCPIALEGSAEEKPPSLALV